MVTEQTLTEDENGWLILHQIRPWLSDYASMMNEHATNPGLPQSLRQMAKTRHDEVVALVRKIP